MAPRGDRQAETGAAGKAELGIEAGTDVQAAERGGRVHGRAPTGFAACLRPPCFTPLPRASQPAEWIARRHQPAPPACGPQADRTSSSTSLAPRRRAVPPSPVARRAVSRKGRSAASPPRLIAGQTHSPPPAGSAGGAGGRGRPLPAQARDADVHAPPGASGRPCASSHSRSRLGIWRGWRANTSSNAKAWSPVSCGLASMAPRSIRSFCAAVEVESKSMIRSAAAHGSPSSRGRRRCRAPRRGRRVALAGPELVHPRAAGDPVLPEAALQHVPAAPAVDLVVAGRGQDPIGAGGPGDPVRPAAGEPRPHPGPPGARRIAAISPAGAQIHRHRMERRVDARAAVQPVRPGAAQDRVVAPVAQSTSIRLPPVIVSAASPPWMMLTRPSAPLSTSACFRPLHLVEIQDESPCRVGLLPVK